MPIINKTKNTAAIYNRGREVVKVYDHGELVWQKSTSIPDYLCFTALEAGQFTLTIPAAVTTTYLSYVEWSKDGRTWNHTDNTSEAVTIDVQVASGEKVYWRGSGVCTTSASASTGRQSIFSSTARFDTSGRVMSLLKGDDCANYDHLERNTVDGCLNVTFAYLFSNCNTIVNAKDLVLPTFTSFHTYIYYRTFYGCGALVSLPPLPSTELAYNCYSNLAFGCSSLLNAVALPATILASGCYNSMYYGCTSLTKGSDLPATNLVLNCYYMMYNGCSSLTDTGTLGFLVTAESSCDRMFQSCSHLNYIKCLATDISATNCLRNWTNGVSSTGTFIQAEGVEWPRGASGIPTGWVDIEKRTMPQGYKQVEYVANPNKPSATPMPIVETGIVLDPSQDTIEIAVFPHIDDDGYIAHHRYGGLPIANNMSPAQSGAKVGRFYCMYRKIDSANVIQFSWTKATSANSTLTATNKIVETPQVLRIELSSGNNKMLLNGTQVATNSDACDISDPGTETAKLFGINNVGYNWIDPIYYMKWWRNGVLIADYVACVRESDNEPSFYDFVSNTFKVPTRTGFFTAGEEI